MFKRKTLPVTKQKTTLKVSTSGDVYLITFSITLFLTSDH